MNTPAQVPHSDASESPVASPLWERFTVALGLWRARFREVISGVMESIQGGSGLSNALADYGDVFNPVFCSLIRAGESTGRLPDVLRSLIDTLKWEDELERARKVVEEVGIAWRFV